MQLSLTLDSRSIERDADLVTFLSNEGYCDRENPELERRAELIVAKQRNAPTGCVPLEFYGPFGAFADPTQLCFAGSYGPSADQHDGEADGTVQRRQRPTPLSRICNKRWQWVAAA